MRVIALTNHMNAFVDDEDFEYLNQWKWQAAKAHNTFYATRSDNSFTPKRTVKMHRVIMNLEHGDAHLVDHINHNGLDNKKSNLRICTDSQNNSNRTSIKNSSSKFLGVTLKIKRRRTTDNKFWYAQIRKDGKTLFLGSFPYTENGEKAAAEMYDKHAKLLHGEFANLNFKES